MAIVSAVALYFVIWWLVFYVVLTIGDRAPDAEDTRVGGAEMGAPARPRLLRRVLITSAGALVVTAAIIAVRHSGLTLDDIPLPSPPGLEGRGTDEGPVNTAL